MGKIKKPRHGPNSEVVDVMYYNNILDSLRQQQESGLAFYGNFLYEPKPVPLEQYSAWQEQVLTSQQHLWMGPKQGGLSGANPSTPGESPAWPNSAPNRRGPYNTQKQNGSTPGQRLGSLNQPGGFTGVYQRPGYGGAPPGIPGAGESPFDDFPAASMAAAYITAAKARYTAAGSSNGGGSGVGGTKQADRWKHQMVAELEARARQYSSGGSGGEGADKAGPFSDEEDMLLLVARLVYGNKWQNVEKAIPGRTAGAIKKHWHSTMRERYKRTAWATRLLLAPPRELTYNPRTREFDEDYYAARPASPGGGGGASPPPGAPPGGLSQLVGVDPIGGLMSLHGSHSAAGLSAGASAGGYPQMGLAGYGSGGYLTPYARDGGGSGSRGERAAYERGDAVPGTAGGSESAQRRRRHVEYVGQLATREAECQLAGQWESLCFVCKAGGGGSAGQMAKCEWGHDIAAEARGGGSGGQVSCWKAYHITCLGPGQAPQGGGQPWACRRHECATASCSVPPLFACRSCPNSFCGNHLPQGSEQVTSLEHRAPLGNPPVHRIVCPTCQATEASTSANSRRAAQRLKARAAAHRLPAAAPLEAASLSAHAQYAGVADDEDEWMHLVEGIRPLPTNNGGPTVDRLRKAITLAAADPVVGKDVVDALEHAISPAVYKSNSAGATKHMALQALDLHRTRTGRAPRGTAAIAPRNPARK